MSKPNYVSSTENPAPSPNQISTPVWIFPAEAPSSAGPELNPFDLLKIVWGYKWLMILFIGICIVYGGIQSLRMPKVYEAETTIIPLTEKESSVGNLLGSVGGLASMIGITGGDMQTTVGIETIVRSRSFQEDVIKSLNLMPILFPGIETGAEAKEEPPPSPTAIDEWKLRIKDFLGIKPSLVKKSTKPTLVDGAKVLAGAVSVQKSQGLIKIRVVWEEDPEISATIANGYAKEMENYIKNRSITSLQNSRVFINKQLEIVKDELQFYETAMKQFTEKYRMLSPEEHIVITNNAIATLKTNLISKNIEYRSLGEGSVQAQFLKEQINNIQKEIDKLQKSNETEDHQSFDYIVPLSKFPDLILEYTRLKRQLDAKTEIYSMLTKQLEVTKIDESKEKLSFQILDPAIPAQFPSQPNLKRALVNASLVGIVGSVVLVFAIELLRRLHRQKREQRKMRQEKVKQETVDVSTSPKST